MTIYGQASRGGKIEKQDKKTPKMKWAKVIRKMLSNFFDVVLTREFHIAWSKAELKTKKNADEVIIM